MKKIRILIFVCITHYSFSQPFSEKTSNGFIFAGEENSAAAFVDVDNDGDEDLLHSSVFYKNNNEEGFSSFFTFVGASNVIAFADYNGDGFADILFGNTLYRSNAGTGFTAIRTFTETSNAISFADFNNNAQADIILTGSTSSVLYRNNNGAFTQEQTLSGGTNSTYGDIDSDGDMDIIISKNTPPYSIIYENRNTGFVSVFENILTRTTTGTPNLIDFDADGDLDIFVSNTLYKNNETGFSSSASLFISSFNNYHSSWADMDNDGFADLVISGTENAIPTLTIYKNNRTSFAAITSIPNITKHTLTDVDSDGDMDLFFSETGRFYENKTTIRNNPPNIPQGLDAIIQGDEILLSWGNVSDIETPIQGIRYELYFSSLRGHNNSFFSAPRQETERRILRPDSAGVYYWTVRSVDAGGLRSNIGSLQRIVLVSTKETSNITPRSATAHWSAIPDASYYIFQLATNANFTNFVTGYRNLILTDNFKTISSLLPNTPYYYRIVAVTPEIKSDYSNTMSFTTLSPGNFISSTIPSASLKNGSSNFVDYDNDGDMDFFTNGQKTIGTTTHSIFQVAKNTNGTFASPTAISNTFSNHTIFGDFNHDNKVDVLMGENFYTNQNPSFSKVSFTFPNIPSGSSNFVDFDNDGDRDVFVTGYNNASAHRVSQLFQNNKTGFSEVFPTNFTDMDLSTSAFGDIDNDGDMDALISGWDGYDALTTMYENRNGEFYELTHTNFTGIKNGSVSLADLNNDGYLDAFTTGDVSNQYFNLKQHLGSYFYGHTNIYLGGYYCVFCFFDPHYAIDNYPSYESRSFLYRNNGSSFLSIGRASSYSISWQNRHVSTLWNSDIHNWVFPKTCISDYDNDGFKDIIIMGMFFDRVQWKTNTFGLANGYWGRIGWGDDTPTYTYKLGIKVYKNNGGGSFTEVFSDVFLEELFNNYTTSIDGGVSDIDNDGDLDIMVNAEVNGNYYSKRYENRTSIPNTPPTAPEGLVGYSYGLGKAVFIWANAEDAQIPEEQTRHTGNGLNYNMYVGTAANKNIIRSAEANTTTGYRWQAEAGSLQGNVYKLENIANGNYVWGIQAIDQGMRGGNWTPEQTLSLQNKTTAQSITFDTLVRKRFLDPPFIVSATTTSGLPVSFLSTNTKVATINGNTVTIIGAGKTNIIAMQSGNSSYYGAYPVTRILNVEKVKQSITFTNVPIQTVGVPFQFSITANSSRPVLFYTQWTRDDLSYWECYYSWYEYGGFYYKYGPDVSRLSDQYFRTQPNCRYVRDSSDIYYTGSPFITVNGISSFSADRTGTTNIAATQEEETLDYLPADQVVQTFFVKGFQTITFFKVGAKVYGDVPFVLDSRSIGAGINLSQRGEISISYSSSNTQILSIVNNTATVRGVGTVSITAFSSGSDLYFPAHTSQVVTIKKARQSITFDLPLSKTFGDAPFKIIAYSQNSFPISFKTSHTFVQIQNDSIQMLGSGVAKIIAFHTGNQYYDSASVVRYLTIIDINKAPQYISFDDIPQDTLRSLQDSIELRFVAISSSSLPIEYAIAHNEDLQNSIVSSRDSFTVTSAGIYTITALQDGDATYNPAIPITKICTIKRSQSIFFTEIPPKNYESAPFYINLYATSGLDTRISLSNDSVLQIDPDYLATITKTGTVNISATQSGDNEYYPAPDAFQSIVIAKADQYLVFKPIPSKVYENPPIILPITTNAGLPIIYSSVSNLIAIAQNTVSILAGGGIAKIAAYNSGNANYNALIPIFRSFYIEKASQDMSFPSVPNKVYGDAPIVFQPTSNKRIPIVYASSNENVIRFEGNSAFILRADANTVTISATANETNSIYRNPKNSRDTRFTCSTSNYFPRTSYSIFA